MLSFPAAILNAGRQGIKIFSMTWILLFLLLKANVLVVRLLVGNNAELFMKKVDKRIYLTLWWFQLSIELEAN